MKRRKFMNIIICMCTWKFTGEDYMLSNGKALSVAVEESIRSHLSYYGLGIGADGDLYPCGVLKRNEILDVDEAYLLIVSDEKWEEVSVKELEIRVSQMAMEIVCGTQIPEFLTAGLLRELIGNRNIPQLSALVEGLDDSAYISVINKEQFVATKLWTKEDVEQVIEENGFEATDDFYKLVIENLDISVLEECRDEEWNAIKDAVKAAGNKKTEE